MSTFSYHNTLTHEEAYKIAQITQQEANLESKTAEQIRNNAQTIWCVLTKHHDKIVWYANLTQYTLWSTSIYELWSVWVDETYRWQKISSSMINKLLATHSNKAIICLTKEAPIHHIFWEKLHRNKIVWSRIQSSPLWDALEQNWDAIDKYDIYSNELATPFLFFSQQ